MTHAQVTALTSLTRRGRKLSPWHHEDYRGDAGHLIENRRTARKCRAIGGLETRSCSTTISGRLSRAAVQLQYRGVLSITRQPRGDSALAARMAYTIFSSKSPWRTRE